MEREGVKIRTSDTEVDELMTSAVVSLRTQLAELEKVASLTDNFYVSYTCKLFHCRRIEPLFSQIKEASKPGNFGGDWWRQ